MKLFDMHCDTALELFNTKQSLKSNNLSISLDKSDCFERWSQVFAIWIPDSIRGNDAYNYYFNAYKYFKSEMENNFSNIVWFGEDNQELIDEKHVCEAILAVEGGAVLAGKLDNLDILNEHGVKLITLTWNGENEIGYGTSENKGLKPFGKQVVSKMEQLDMIVDVSHLCESGFNDVVEISTKPFVASHSNAYSVCNHVRNLKDYQIKEIINRNGLIGLNFYWKFITNKHNNSDTFDEIFDHIEHFMSVGAQDVLCLGSDFDGCDPIKKLGNISDVNELYNFLLRKNYSECLVNKIFFDNANDFFKVHRKIMK